MPLIDVMFPVLGTTLPTDHAYALYSALTALVPAYHKPGSRLAFAPVSGHYEGRGLLRLHGRSRLRFRLPAEQIALLLPLAGKPLGVGGHRIRLGVPHVLALVPAPTLAARVVTFK